MLNHRLVANQDLGETFLSYFEHIFTAFFSNKAKKHISTNEINNKRPISRVECTREVMYRSKKKIAKFF